MRTITWIQDTRYSRHVHTASVYEECLLQLFYGVTWDGDLISKQEIKSAINKGHAHKTPGGWNLITREGVAFLALSGAIHQ